MNILHNEIEISDVEKDISEFLYDEVALASLFVINARVSFNIEELANYLIAIKIANYDHVKLAIYKLLKANFVAKNSYINNEPNKHGSNLYASNLDILMSRDELFCNRSKTQIAFGLLAKMADGRYAAIKSISNYSVMCFNVMLNTSQSYLIRKIYNDMIYSSYWMMKNLELLNQYFKYDFSIFVLFVLEKINSTIMNYEFNELKHIYPILKKIYELPEIQKVIEINPDLVEFLVKRKLTSEYSFSLETPDNFDNVIQFLPEYERDSFMLNHTEDYEKVVRYLDSKND